MVYCTICNWDFYNNITYIVHFISNKHGNNLSSKLYENKDSQAKVTEILIADCKEILESLDKPSS